MKRAHSLVLALLALEFALVVPLGAQRMVCEPPAMNLRPGESSCIEITTTPLLRGVPLQPNFDPSLVSITPPITLTDQNGQAVFTVTSKKTNLSGTPVRIDDVSGRYASCTSQVICDFPELRLESQPGIVTGAAPGQFGLQLTAPTPVDPGEFGLILFSLQTGTFPASVFGPGDPRLVSLDPLSLQLFSGHLGLFAAPGLQTFAAPSFRVRRSGAQLVLYAQGMTLKAGPSLIQRLSLPRPIRFAPANTFNTGTPRLSTPRSFFPVLQDQEGRPVIAGGGDGAVFAQMATARVEKYDPLTDTFIFNITDMTEPRSLHTGTRLQNGKWLVTGGVDFGNNPLDSAELYDPATDQFRSVGRMASVRTGHTATLLANGTVFIAGGLTQMSADPIATAMSAERSTEIFTLDATGCNGAFSAGPAMNLGRAGHQALLLPDGRVYIMGGIGPIPLAPFPATWSTTEFYDGSGFTVGPQMPTARAIFPVTEITRTGGPNRYLAAGGLGDILGIGAPTDAADVYTFVTRQPGSWSRAGTMNAARGIQDAYRFGDQVIQMGGLQGNLTVPSATDTTDIYDIVLGTWTAGPTLSTPRGTYGSYQDPYGRVHLLGGVEGYGPNPSVGITTDTFTR